MLTTLSNNAIYCLIETAIPVYDQLNAAPQTN